MMKTLALIKPCSWIYLTLIALSVLTWSVGESGAGGLSISTLVLLLALIKGVLIGDYFMGLKQVNSAWRWSIHLWLLIPAGLILLAFISAHP